jgi:predicted O-methyltransferase YrrM
MTIKEALERAENLQSKIPEEYISKLTGLSSPKIWHLLNNLAAMSDSYLEIGTYMGSSLMAALYENQVEAVAIDNFCMKPKTRGHFFQNVKYLNFKFIEADCFEVQFVDRSFQLYFYDGGHTYNDQYRALVHFLHAMQTEFVYVCDDWNNGPVREGTFAAIKDCDLEILEFHERRCEMKDKNEWWCGIAIFKFRKK